MGLNPKYFGGALNALMGGHPLGALQQILHTGVGGFATNVFNAINPFGASGGLVTSRGIQGYQMGGVVDNIPAWLTAGEGVLNRTAMSGIGVGGLNYLNAGGNFNALGGQDINITVNSILDGRVIARSVLRETLRQAARGPASLSGGALATGVGSTTG
jgi:hypothetical protein